jgi:hypothetical protein
MLTFGGLGIWWIVDLVMLAMGQFEDAEGRVMGPPRPSKRQRLDGPPRREDARRGDRADASGHDGTVSASSSTDRKGEREDPFVIETDDGEKVTIDDSEIMGDSLDEEFEKLERQQQATESTG